MVVLVTIVAMVWPLSAVSNAQAAGSTVSLRVSPAPAAPGESVVLSGAVSPLASGRTVSLQRYGRSWSTVASVVTSSNGRFSLSMRAGVAGSTTSWRAVARPTSVAGQAISPTKSMGVTRQVLTLHAPVSAVARHAFVLWGYTYPVRARRVVVVQRLSGRSWVQVGRTTTSSTGRYSVRASVSSVGKFTYRAVAGSWRGAAGVVSVRRVVSARLARTAPATFRLDYQSGNFSQWTEQQYYRSAQQAIVTTPARSGYTDTARFIVGPRDYTNGGVTAERSEVRASAAQSGYPVNGQTMWWAWSMYLPSGFYVDSDAESPVGNGWLIVTQWHCESNTGGGHLGISLGLTKGTTTPHLYLDATNSEWVDPQPLPLGVWNDFVMGITWGDSNHAGVGHVTFKLNGSTLVDAAANTLQVGQSAYFKQGLYRAASNRTHTIYYTGTRRGPTLASVAR